MDKHKARNSIIWGVVVLWVVIVVGVMAVIMISVATGSAQVTPGTVFSKTEDGNGNKITSTVVGPSRGLDVSIIAGGGGGPTYLDADGIANQTASAVHGQTYMYNGATWDRVRGTIAGGLQVNCITGCAGGSSTPTDAFANPTTAGIQQDFLMGYNGATWDRLRSSIANGLVVDVSRVQSTVGVTQSTSPWVISGAVTNANLDVALSTRLADATFTGRFTAAALDADAIANETTTSIHGKCYLYNGATWDRCRGAITTGLLVNVSNASIGVTQSTSPWVVSGTVGVSNAFLLDATFTGRINTLGQKAMAASTPVVLPSDQSAIPVTVLSTVGTANNDGACPSGAVNFTVAASNASRTWLAIWASPANTDDVYIKLGVTATNVDGRISPGQPINFTSGRIYTGQIDAFPNSGTQAVCLMELN